MKITAIKVKTQDLKEGDLFSNVGQDYWDLATGPGTCPVGERVYIRTNAPCPKDQVDEDIYRVTIEQG